MKKQITQEQATELYEALRSLLRNVEEYAGNICGQLHQDNAAEALYNVNPDYSAEE